MPETEVQNPSWSRSESFLHPLLRIFAQRSVLASPQGLTPVRLSLRLFPLGWLVAHCWVPLSPPPATKSSRCSEVLVFSAAPGQMGEPWTGSPSTEAAWADAQLDKPYAPSPALGLHGRHGAGPMESSGCRSTNITSHCPSRALELKKLIRGQMKIPNKPL